MALQEVTARSVSLLRVTLQAVGFSHLIDSFTASPLWTAEGPRRYGLLIASRYPVMPATHAQVAAWPERLLSAQVLTPNHAVTVHTTHIPPGSSNKGTKIEAVLAVVSESSAAPRILCGDFNLPQAETPQGRIVTWAERVKVEEEPRLRYFRRSLESDPQWRPPAPRPAVARRL